ncbi:hypothetical protein COOONC_22172 [Cooperia oncophora]
MFSVRCDVGINQTILNSLAYRSMCITSRKDSCSIFSKVIPGILAQFSPKSLGQISATCWTFTLYKSSVLTIAAVAGALLLSYFYLSSACCKQIAWCMRRIRTQICMHTASAHSTESILFPKRRKDSRRNSMDLRSCVRLAPTLPTSSDVSFRKRHSEEDTLICETDCQNLYLDACHTAERIRSAAKALSMTHGVYEVLFLSDIALPDFQAQLYGKDEQGICIEPAPFAEFMKEIEFFEEFNHRIERATREAQNH